MARAAGIRLGKAFCSARDMKIPALVRHGEWETRVPSARDAAEAVICLDYGVRCTGWLCPLFDIPPLPPEDLVLEAIEAERAQPERSSPRRWEILEEALLRARARSKAGPAESRGPALGRRHSRIHGARSAEPDSFP